MHHFPKVSSSNSTKGKSLLHSESEHNSKDVPLTVLQLTDVFFSVIGQLDKALPANILDKYNDRVQEESINLAALDDLVR